MDSNGLRVGFVGTGWTERIQIPVFRMGGLTAQAICSGRRKNAERVARNLNVPDVHDDWQALVESEAVDIVSVVTPPHLHLEIAEAALAAGKHVIAEKPTALNVTEAEAMLAAAQAAPNQLAIIDHELRFEPARLQMRELIRNGYVGTVLHVNMTRLGPDRLNRNQPWNWFSDAERGGGMLGALGSHLIDLARWMIGRIDGMTAQLKTGHLYRMDPVDGSKRVVSSDDHAQLTVRFGAGAVGNIVASGLTPGGYGMSIEVVGTNGALRLDNQDQLWGLQGDAVQEGVWQPIRVKYHGLDREALPTRSPFAVGSYYLARTLADSLAAGEHIIADAASFYDGLVIQRALDAARAANAERTWQEL